MIVAVMESKEGEGSLGLCVWGGEIMCRMDRVKAALKEEKPCVEEFVEANEGEISRLCEASWCLRLISIGCKENNSSGRVATVFKERL